VIPIIKNMLRAAAWLTLFVMIGISLLLITKHFTQENIDKAEQAAIKKTFDEVMPNVTYSNQPYLDTKIVVDKATFNTKEPITFYRVRNNNKPVGLIVKTLAPDGYNGKIHIIMAVTPEGKITGVRIISHKETPGLGDKIELKKSNWILQFDGKYLTPDNLKSWKVKKDGGKFDQFTGATITPRAIVKAIKTTLDYINKQGDSLYE
jgi:electron transport complex protein RnfG